MIASECPEPGQLERLLLGKLDRDDSKSLGDHLLHCHQCLVRAAAIESADELTDALASNPIADVTGDSLKSVIAESEKLVGAPSESTVRCRVAPAAPDDRPANAEVAKRTADARFTDCGLDIDPDGFSDARYPEVPGFEIHGTLGVGGMGVVYRARQIKLNRTVALKMIRAHALFDPEAMGRFRTEAESIARLSHPNIISVYEVGEVNRQPYVALEFVSGGSLADLLSRTTVTSRVAAEFVSKLARAVQYAHDRGVIHRDIKPANVLLSTTSIDQREPDHRQPDHHRPEGQRETTVRDESTSTSQIPLDPKITDFGLARLTHLDDRQTRTGTVIGTPAYMAPEQAQGKHDQVGTAADIYSLGAILYELMTGRAPFRADTPVDTLRQVIDDDPITPRVLNRELSKDLETICMKCLQKQPHARYHRAAELADDLDRYLTGKPVIARPLYAHVRLARWCRRRPTVASLLGTIVLLLSTVAIGSSLFAVRVTRLNRVAIEAKQDSDHDRAVAVSAITKLSNALYQDLSRRGGTVKEREKLIDVAISGLEHVTKNESRLADAGVIYGLLAAAELHSLQGDLESTDRSLNRAFGLASELVDTFPNDPAHAYALAQVHEGKATLAFNTTGAESAVADIDAATEILQRLIQDSPDNPALMRSLLRVRRSMVSVYEVRQDAEAVYNECTTYLPMAERLVEFSPDGGGRDVLAEVQRLLHVSGRQIGQRAVADQHGKAALEHFTDLKTAAPDDTRAAYGYCKARVTQAMAHAEQGRSVEASQAMDDAIGGLRELAALDRDDLDSKYSLADGLRWKCYQSCYTYDLAALKEAAYESIDLARELIERSPANHRFKALFIAASGHAAESAKHDGDWQELDARLAEAVQVYRSLDADKIDIGFEGSFGPVFETVWEATQRQFDSFSERSTTDGTCALLCLYSYLESMQGRFELSPSTRKDIARTCGLELSDQDAIFTAMQRLDGRSEYWLAATLIHEAMVYGFLAEQATDPPQQAKYLERAVAAIGRVKREHPQMAAICLFTKIELQWVRQTELYQRELGDKID